MCRDLDADAVAISRVIGDVLILIVERVPEGMTLQQGAGYLIPDYPQTAQVLDSGAPLTLTLADPDVDEDEARVLRDLGFGALAMLPLYLNSSTWGLIEIYRTAARSFTNADVQRAVELSRVS